VLASLARFAVRRRRLMVFGIWIPFAIIIVALSGAIGNNFRTEMKLPSSESRQAQDILAAVNPSEGGTTAQIVFKSSLPFTTPSVKDAITKALDAVKALGQTSVQSPYDFPNQFSRTGTIAFAQLSVPKMTTKQMDVLAGKVENAVDTLKNDNMQVEYGGQLFKKFALPDSEALGLLAAIVILVLAFGSVLAMGLPIGIALIGLVIASSIVSIVSNVVSMPDQATSMVAMIGLGVGIDYALFIVTRFREALHDGLSIDDSIIEAVDTSGRAVLFAGTTVIIALLGLLTIGLAFVSGFAVAMAIGVAVMVVASLTLLPSLLAMAGNRIDVTTRAAVLGLITFVASGFVAVFTKSGAIFGVGTLVAAILVSLRFVVPALRKPIPHKEQNNHQESVWWRWSRVIQRRPWTSLILAALALGLLAIPTFGMRLGFSDFGNEPANTTTRRAYDLVAEGFGPGFNGPLYIAVTGDAVGNPAKLKSFADTINATPDVAFATPIPLKSDAAALVMVYPKSSPQAKATSVLVHKLRKDIIPASGVQAKVGGFTAGSIDFSDYLGARLPYLIGVVLLVSFFLLMVVFRSLLVPLKAVLMNLLSVGASYGVIVAVFQWGWFSKLFGVGAPGPIEAWAPMFLFAIVFGLSMDYEVFLLTRMKEEFERTGDNEIAVADGLAATARVITAAAAIMVCVFAAFVLSPDRSLKLFGLGMAVAVFVDATIVRMLLVPATMELLGARNWWIPKWLDKVLPRIDVEGHHHESPAPHLEDLFDDPHGDLVEAK